MTKYIGITHTRAHTNQHIPVSDFSGKVNNKMSSAWQHQETKHQNRIHRHENLRDLPTRLASTKTFLSLRSLYCKTSRALGKSINKEPTRVIKIERQWFWHFCYLRGWKGELEVWFSQLALAMSSDNTQNFIPTAKTHQKKYGKKEEWL